MQLEFAAEGLGQCFDGDVVPRRAEAPGHEHDVDPTRRPQEGIGHVHRVVVHRTVEARVHIDVEQPLGEERLVRVDDLAAQQFIADRNYFGDHAPPPGNPVVRNSAVRSPAADNANATRDNTTAAKAPAITSSIITPIPPW